MISTTTTNNGAAVAVQNFLVNYLSTMFFIWLGYYFFTEISFYHMAQYSHQWTPQWKDWNSGLTITTQVVFRAAVIAYALLLVPYYLVNPTGQSKASLALRGLSKVFISKLGAITHIEKQGIAACGIKFFFVPFILDAFLQHCMTINYKTCDLFRWSLLDKFERPLFVQDINHLFFEVLFALVLLFDIVPFVVGYLVESKSLDNQVKSVETTWAGWFFCVMSYPPFNGAVSSFARTDFNEYVAPFHNVEWGVYLQFGLNIGALVLMALYSSASVSLGWKASNLCSRGVVSSGLYKYVRHPAYASKNLAWWLFAIGTAVHVAQAGKSYLPPLFALAFWNWVYYMRAYTEELHLARSDPDYLEYMKKVPYRFIPGIF